jgi:hypothetical protein
MAFPQPRRAGTLAPGSGSAPAARSRRQRVHLAAGPARPDSITGGNYRRPSRKAVTARSCQTAAVAEGPGALSSPKISSAQVEAAIRFRRRPYELDALRTSRLLRHDDQLCCSDLPIWRAGGR